MILNWFCLQALTKQAYEGGCTYFDTAEDYAAGVSEVRLVLYVLDCEYIWIKTARIHPGRVSLVKPSRILVLAKGTKWSLDQRLYCLNHSRIGCWAVVSWSHGLMALLLNIIAIAQPLWSRRCDKVHPGHPRPAAN